MNIVTDIRLKPKRKIQIDRMKKLMQMRDNPNARKPVDMPPYRSGLRVFSFAEGQAEGDMPHDRSAKSLAFIMQVIMKFIVQLYKCGFCSKAEVCGISVGSLP